mmetsp:Transcript_19778/g.61902  ORF Transcript_19778/g.61902 Transcript_19778/m.61902 type:complete len:209 (-) Transcript_19778:115-741(-)
MPSEVREQVQQLAVQRAENLHRRLEAGEHHFLQLQEPDGCTAERPQVNGRHELEGRIADICACIRQQALKVRRDGAPEDLSRDGAGVRGGVGQLLLLPHRQRRRWHWQREVGWRCRPVRGGAVSRAWDSPGAEVGVELQQVGVPLDVLAVRGRPLLPGLVEPCVAGRGAAVGGGSAAVRAAARGAGAAATAVVRAAWLCDGLVKTEQA